MRYAVVLLALLATHAHAQLVPCSDKSLTPEQGWNPPDSSVTPPLARFYQLSGKMVAAYNGSNPLAAEPIARDYLLTSQQYRCNWNYGNAEHDANTILGLLALHAGKSSQAVEFLSAAGASTGSPQLNTFGPSMILAKELSQAGKHAGVIKYLHSVQRFWRLEGGAIDRWVSELEAKRTPDFGANLRPL